MRDSRKAVIFLADNLIPVYEGDVVKVFIPEEDNPEARWYPRSGDYKTPDETRLTGKQNYLRLKPNEYALLENAKRLVLMLQPNEKTYIYRVAPEKRRPLLRLPRRGLPFRRV
jgi:hypothetical protein